MSCQASGTPAVPTLPPALHPRYTLTSTVLTFYRAAKLAIPLHLHQPPVAASSGCPPVLPPRVTGPQQTTSQVQLPRPRSVFSSRPTLRAQRLPLSVPGIPPVRTVASGDIVGDHLIVAPVYCRQERPSFVAKGEPLIFDADVFAIHPCCPREGGHDAGFCHGAICPLGLCTHCWSSFCQIGKQMFD